VSRAGRLTRDQRNARRRRTLSALDGSSCGQAIGNRYPPWVSGLRLVKAGVRGGFWDKERAGIAPRPAATCNDEWGSQGVGRRPRVSAGSRSLTLVRRDG
jgi:hypothetical protein